MRYRLELMLTMLLWGMEIAYHLTQWEEFTLRPMSVKLQKWSRFTARQAVKKQARSLAYRDFSRHKAHKRQHA